MTKIIAILLSAVMQLTALLPANQFSYTYTSRTGKFAFQVPAGFFSDESTPAQYRKNSGIPDEFRILYETGDTEHLYSIGGHKEISVQATETNFDIAELIEWQSANMDVPFILRDMPGSLVQNMCVVRRSRIKLFGDNIFAGSELIFPDGSTVCQYVTIDQYSNLYIFTFSFADDTVIQSVLSSFELFPVHGNVIFRSEMGLYTFEYPAEYQIADYKDVALMFSPDLDGYLLIQVSHPLIRYNMNMLRMKQYDFFDEIKYSYCSEGLPKDDIRYRGFHDYGDNSYFCYWLKMDGDEMDNYVICDDSGNMCTITFSSFDEEVKEMILSSFAFVE